MRTARRALLAALLLATGPALARPGCPALPRTFPLPREASAEELPSDDWRSRSRQLEARLAATDRGRIQLAFIGDSITEAWEPGLWRQFYGHRAAFNLGLWGDFTNGALHRLARSQWEGLRPRVVVLLIGTNNLAWNHRPADVAMGIAELVRLVQERSPRTKVLVLGLLPRGASAADPMRAQVAEVNALVARCADEESTFYLDVGRLLLDAQGAMPDHISGDKLHLTPVGYAILATAMEPTLRRMLGE